MMSDSSTSLERLVHLFGYAICSFEPTADFNEIRNTNLERNHVVFVAILFSCQGTDVRERAAILPDPHVRVKRVGSTPGEPNPSDADTLTLSICCLEKICGPELPCRLQGRGSVRSGYPFVNYQFDSRRGAVDCLPRPGSWSTRPPSSLFQLILLHNLLCRFELWPVFQRSRTAQGPAVTTLPQVLFQRFRHRSRIRETDVARRPVEGETAPLSPPRVPPRSPMSRVSVTTMPSATGRIGCLHGRTLTFQARTFFRGTPFR